MDQGIDKPRFRSAVDHVLRFAPLLVPVVAIVAAVQIATPAAYIFLAGFLVSYAISQLIVKIIKKALKQGRPPGADERCGTIWEPVDSAKKPGYGMPSGHSAASAIALTFGILLFFDDAKVLSKEIDATDFSRYSRLAGAGLLAAYCLAVMLHRIVIRCHYVSQVATGAVIGITVGSLGYVASKAVVTMMR